MDDVRIDVGVYTPLQVDLTQFDFTGIDRVILTVKNMLGGIVLEREFSTATTHMVEITPKESRLMRNDAEYDFDIISSAGKRYKNGDNGRIVLRKGCGECNESR